jgi:competence protein ComEC
LKFWALLIMGAVSPFLFSSTLTSSTALVFLLLLALLCIIRSFRIVCLLPAFFLLTTLAINERLSQRWPLSESKTLIEVSGVISSLPDTNGDVVRFNFLPDGTEKVVPAKLRVYWYKNRHHSVNEKTNVPEIRAGERWRLQLELRSPRGRVNFHGVDAERRYFTDGIGALAYVQPGDNVRLAAPGLFDLQHWRQSVLDKLAEKAVDVPSFRMLAALAVADRRALLGRDRAILSATGTGHLLAISGLHIGLAAAMGFYLGRLVFLFLSVNLKHRFAISLPWLMAWSAALVYAALSGFGVSTQRALIMLSVATVVMLSRRSIHPFHAWLVAMALVLIVDPFAPLRAGFWFSFTAVAVLMMLFVPRYGYMPGWKKMILAQLGISLLMAPMGMYWFQQASAPGLLANLLAIPVISMLVVPLILIALLVLWLPGPLAEWLLTAAGYSVHFLFLALEQFSVLQPQFFSSTRAPTLGATVLAMLGACLLLLPRGLPGRYAGVLLLLPILLPTAQSLADTETQIDFLDVGQGLAVLLTTQEYLMIYDTGPGNGLIGERAWDMVDGTITPMIKAQGRSPDLIVASHADLDHAGGLSRLRTDYPNALSLASLAVNRAGIRPCMAPDIWMGGKLIFKTLHPSKGLPYLGNDSSCVISVNGPGLKLLLSGDISQVVEQRLVETGLQQHDILTAPHHGSSTSSSQILIDAVKPSWVLVSAAMNNRFGFPRADVVGRYTKAHIPILNTAECGGIRLTSNENGVLRVESARLSRAAIWRWPADASCPLDG